MNQTRSGAAVAVVGDLLYAIGGHDGPEIRKSVEVYEPVSDTWTLCAPMICARRNAGECEVCAGVVCSSRMAYVTRKYIRMIHECLSARCPLFISNHVIHFPMWEQGNSVGSEGHSQLV